MSESALRKRDAYIHGLKSGLPIGLGYLVVGFSIGIAAKNAGITIIQALVASFFTNTSTGEYLVFTQAALGATLAEIASLTLITNARYLLMSCALSQRLDPKTSLIHRLIIGSDITDELFGVSIGLNGNIHPYFYYGCMTTSIPFWSAGTVIGLLVGSFLPDPILKAFTTTLFGMFISVFVPASKTDHHVLIAVLAAVAFSVGFDYIPFLSGISSGTKILILTIVISAIIAIIFPVKDKSEDGEVTE